MVEKEEEAGQKPDPSRGWLGDEKLNEVAEAVVPAFLRRLKVLESASGYPLSQLVPDPLKFERCRLPHRFVRVFVPLPLWNHERGGFKVEEITLLRVDLITKSSLLRAIEHVENTTSFFDRELVDSSLTLVIYLSKAVRKQQNRHPNYTYFIRQGPSLKHLIFKFIGGAMQCQLRAASKAKFLQPTAPEIVSALEYLKADFDSLRRQAISELNAKGGGKTRGK